MSIIGHSCDSYYPTMNRQKDVRGNLRGCEHIRIDSPLTHGEAVAVMSLMERAGLRVSYTKTHEETR